MNCFNKIETIGKKNKEGLKGRFKIVGQIGVGIIVGATLYFNDNVTIKEKLPLSEQQELIASNVASQPGMVAVNISKKL